MHTVVQKQICDLEHMLFLVTYHLCRIISGQVKFRWFRSSNLL